MIIIMDYSLQLMNKNNNSYLVPYIEYQSNINGVTIKFNIEIKDTYILIKKKLKL